MPPIRRIGGTWVLAALLAAGPARGEEREGRALAVAQAESRAVARAAAKARPSVVAVRALGKGRDGFGAGIVVAEKGLVLTAFHVVKGAAALAMLLDDGEEYPGKLLAVHEASDLALVRIVAPGRTFPPVRFAADGKTRVGETVIAISNPFGLGTSVSRGVLSARDRRHVVAGNDAPLLQTDAAINPGSSGGALVNLEGEVIGLITAILTRSGGHEGVGFAVPALELQRALKALERGEVVRRPWLGVRVARAVRDRPGLRVLGVAPGGPGARGGLQKGDLILRLRDERIARLGDLRSVLRSSEVGDTLEVEVLRDGDPLQLAVEVGSRNPPLPAAAKKS